MKRPLAIASTVILLTSLAGCANQQEMADVKAHLDAVDKRLAALEAQKPAPPPVAQTAPPTATATASTPKADVAAGFTDISGVFGEKEIKDEAKWHIFDPLSGKFEPHKPITRAEFVRWLVRAQNSYHCLDRSDNKLRMPEDNVSGFPDVAPSNPDYKYIQALVNAGFVVGYDDKLFKPDAILTREQMIGIKAPVDYGKDLGKATLADLKNPYNNLPKFTDIDKISPRYYAAFLKDGSGGAHNTSDNIKRLCGTTKFFKPLAPVTRAEAALCLWSIGTYETTQRTADRDVVPTLIEK